MPSTSCFLLLPCLPNISTLPSNISFKNVFRRQYPRKMINQVSLPSLHYVEDITSPLGFESKIIRHESIQVQLLNVTPSAVPFRCLFHRAVLLNNFNPFFNIWPSATRRTRQWISFQMVSTSSCCADP